MIIIFGLRRSRMGQYQVKVPECPSCRHETHYTVEVYGRYFHVFFLPVFPTGRKTVARCNHCGFEFTNLHQVPSLYPAYLQASAIQKPKRPFWHFLVPILGAGFMAITIISMLVVANTPENPKRKLYDADKDKLTAAPVWDNDSVACMVKYCIDDDLSRTMEVEKYEYYSRQQGDKLLMIVKMHDLKQVKKESRKNFLYLVEDCLRSDSLINTKQLYIAIEGKWNLLMTKTPAGEDLSQYASASGLYGFYE